MVHFMHFNGFCLNVDGKVHETSLKVDQVISRSHNQSKPGVRYCNANFYNSITNI